MPEDTQPNQVSIDTSLYIRTGKVKVDGMAWTVKLPGAKTDLKMSRLQRRLKHLDHKIEENTATDEDYNEYDEAEQWYYDVLRDLFQDGSKNNAQVHKWVDETPMFIIIAAFEDIKNQADKKN